MSRPLHLAGAIDLGSTHIKGGLLSADGGVAGLLRIQAPAARSVGERCESDPHHWTRAAGSLLKELSTQLPAGAPLGLASQRSSFLLWSRRDGRPVIPVISWRDRRARSWLARHPDMQEEVRRRAGLVLTAHHIAPKLAALQEEDPDLAAALHAGELLFGTLETWLGWHWSNRRHHITDPTMAARSGLMDVARLDWSPALLDRFGVPRSALPAIVPSSGRDHELASGLRLTASAADQAICSVTTLGTGAGRALVSLGTGTFVMGPMGPVSLRREGFLTGLLPTAAGAGPVAILEAPIHAGLPRAWDGRSFPAEDPAPDLLCMPDRDGVGAPHWLAGPGPVFSTDAPAEARGLALAEGLLFRIAESLAGLFDGMPAPQVVLAGGNGRGRLLAGGLGALLERPVAICREPQQVLLGALRLAAGLPPGEPALDTVVPAGCGYLAAKMARWSRWRGLPDRKAG